MSYEKHLCSVKHLLNELDPNADTEAIENELESIDKSNQDASDDEFDFNPDEFVTLDEVGDDDDDNDGTTCDDNDQEELSEGMVFITYLR